MEVGILIATIAVLGTVAAWMSYCPIKAKAKENKRRVLCIGDSITFGYGVRYTRWKDSYPAKLEKLLGPSYQVLNYGISGATLQDEGDKPYSKRFLKAARKTNPEICILMLGTNDSKPQNWNAERYEKELERRITEIKSFPSSPMIHLMIPPAAFGTDSKPALYGIRDDIIRDNISSIIKRQARLRNVGLVDLYEITEDHPELFADGIHPNANGNKVIAQFIYEVLNKSFGV